jgi:hypothetical protein
VQVGDLVRWKSTSEMGVVVELHKLSFRVCWFASDRPACGYGIGYADIEVVNESR